MGAVCEVSMCPVVCASTGVAKPGLRGWVGQCTHTSCTWEPKGGPSVLGAGLHIQGICVWEVVAVVWCPCFPGSPLLSAVGGSVGCQRCLKCD